MDERIILSLYSLTSFNELNQRNKIKKVGLSTGVNYVDDIIGGLDKGTVNTIMAYTSQGKSMWASNIAYKNTYEKDYNVCMISLEVTKEEIEHEMKHNKENQVSNDVTTITIIEDIVISTKVSNCFSVPVNCC